MTVIQKSVRAAELGAVLKERIMRWEYLPGHRFTEEDICREFGVSRSPVRETLRMLEEQGLVEKVPYRGCTVKQPDVQTINELYDVRMILELAVIEQLAKNGVSQASLDGIAVVWMHLSQATIFAEVADVDLAQEDRIFHESMARLTGNITLLDMLCSINERLHFMRMIDITTIERLRDTCRQHLAIIEAIRSGDAVLAQEAMRRNIEGARQHVKVAISEALARGYLSKSLR